MLVGEVAPETSGEPHRAGRRAAIAGLSGWAAVIAASQIWVAIAPLDPRAGVKAPPFYGHWATNVAGTYVFAIAIGVGAVALLPRACRAIPPRSVPALAGTVGVLWAVTLSVSGNGLHRLSSPIESRYEALPFALGVEARSFVRTFVERADSYPTHVKGHPPGAVLVFRALDELGLGQPVVAAGLVLVAWGAGITAVVWSVSRFAGTDSARRAAPFVALAPAAIWAATSIDALIAGVAAVGLAMVAVATITPRSDPLALGGGVALGVALHLSYGVAALLVVPVVLAVHHRRARPLVAAAVGITAVSVPFLIAGFWWWSGLVVTRGFYLEGLSRVRPYGYFVLVGNLAAFAIAIGPAAAAGAGRLASQRPLRRDAVLMGSVALAIALADLSGMSKAEVERIWLPFAVWLAAAGGAAPRRWTPVLLGASVGIGLAMQAWLVTPW